MAQKLELECELKSLQRVGFLSRAASNLPPLKTNVIVFPSDSPDRNIHVGGGGGGDGGSGGVGGGCVCL